MAKCKNCKNLLAKEEIRIGHLHSYKWCPVINDNPDDERERNCYDFECMTNADKIRSMTDEEIANFITNIRTKWIDEYEYVYIVKGKQLAEFEDVMELLKSEVGCE